MKIRARLQMRIIIRARSTKKRIRTYLQTHKHAHTRTRADTQTHTNTHKHAHVHRNIPVRIHLVGIYRKWRRERRLDKVQKKKRDRYIYTHTPAYHNSACTCTYISQLCTHKYVYAYTHIDTDMMSCVTDSIELLHVIAFNAFDFFLLYASSVWFIWVKSKS